MVTKTLTSSYEIVKGEDWGTLICNGGMFDELIEEASGGTQVTVRDITKTTTYADGRPNISESYTDHRVYCIVSEYTSNDIDVREGIWKAGETVLIFRPSDYRVVKPGNKVRVRDKWFEIEELRENPMGGMYGLYCNAKRI